MAVAHRVVLIRHGESEWDPINLFCGWFDAKLTSKGIAEAGTAGKTLKAEGFTFDVAHVSVLNRAQVTLNIILQEIGQPDLPIQKTWRLNEKHHGGLTGLSREEAAAKYGEPLLQMWARCFDLPPPPMETNHLYYTTIVKDPRYENELKPSNFPKVESLKMTVERTLSYWHEVIVPEIEDGKNVIISAHGNTLKAIVMHLDSITEQEITNLYLPTGIPFVYELDENLKPVNSMMFLGDEETVMKAMMDNIAQEK